MNTAKGGARYGLGNQAIALRIAYEVIRHAWVNRGKEVARAAFVLIDAKPLGIGHPIVRGENAR